MFFFMQNNIYGLISADYNAFADSLSIYERSKQVTDSFHSRLAKYCKENQIDIPSQLKDSQNVIILWRNVPQNGYYNFETNTVWGEFCKVLPDNSTVYVYSTKCLYESNLDSFILNTAALRQKCTVKFMDNQALSTVQSKRKPIEQSDDIEQVTQEVWNREQVPVMLDIAQQIIFDALSELCVVTPIREQTEQDFVSLYFKWQNDEISVKEIAEILDISRRTFYKYAEDFENSGYYGEYLKMHWQDYINRPKRGLLPNKEPFLTDYKMYQGRQLTEQDLCVKYNIPIAIDIERINAALVHGRKKIKNV